jgi:hypothetical protein
MIEGWSIWIALSPALRKRTSSCPLQHIKQSKCIKSNYGHQYTADAVLQYVSFKFLRRTIENTKNILNYCYKNVSFALLNGWNVTKLDQTKTSFDNA